MYAMPKISQKLIDDAATNVEAWLADKVADKFGRVEGTACWGGTGVGQPFGLASYTTAATATFLTISAPSAMAAISVTA